MLTRRRLLWGGLAASVAGSLGVSTPGADDRRLIVVYANGGWDPTYSFDAKLGSPHVDGPEVDAATDHPDDVDALEVLHGHPVCTNPIRRPSVGRFFERWGHRCLALTGVVAGGIAHPSNRMRLLTGSTALDGVDLVSLVGSRTSVAQPLGAVDLGGWSLHGEAYGGTLSRAGATWQLERLLHPTDSEAGLPGPLDDPEADAMVARFLRRRAEQTASPTDPRRWSSALREGVDRLEAVRARQSELATLFARQPTDLRDNVDLAIDLVAGDWARAVMVDSTLYFDTHTGNADQSFLQQRLFDALDRLITGLDAAGELDRTLVLVTSEMVRSPRQNRSGGKDHWPMIAYLALGGGVQGGRRLGGTDDQLVPVGIDLAAGTPWEGGRPARYDEVLAGLAHHLGIDPAEVFPGRTPLGGWAG